MRQGSNAKRSRSRGGKKKNLPLRLQTFDSNGPDGKVRGNAHQVHEKYMALARDAASAGHHIDAESYFQYAEHYHRIVNESMDPGQKRTFSDAEDHQDDMQDDDMAEDAAADQQQERKPRRAQNKSGSRRMPKSQDAAADVQEGQIQADFLTERKVVSA